MGKSFRGNSKVILVVLFGLGLLDAPAFAWPPYINYIQLDMSSVTEVRRTLEASQRMATLYFAGTAAVTGKATALGKVQLSIYSVGTDPDVPPSTTDVPHLTNELATCSQMASLVMSSPSKFGLTVILGSNSSLLGSGSIAIINPAFSYGVKLSASGVNQVAINLDSLSGAEFSCMLVNKGR